jgi:hypothetical protein
LALKILAAFPLQVDSEQQAHDPVDHLVAGIDKNGHNYTENNNKKSGAEQFIFCRPTYLEHFGSYIFKILYYFLHMSCESDKQVWRDSNPQPMVLETTTLPIELQTYGVSTSFQLLLVCIEKQSNTFTFSRAGCHSIAMMSY